MLQLLLRIQFHRGLMKSLIAGEEDDRLAQLLEIAHGFVQRDMLLETQLAQPFIATGDLLFVILREPLPKVPENVAGPATQFGSRKILQVRVFRAFAYAIDHIRGNLLRVTFDESNEITGEHGNSSTDTLPPRPPGCQPASPLAYPQSDGASSLSRHAGGGYI